MLRNVEISMILSKMCHENNYVFKQSFQVIFANVSTKDRSPVTLDGAAAPLDITFTYSAKWIPTQ